MSYADFLAKKERLTAAVGPPISADEIHPLLHQWQREVVAWACRTGRAAIFADCGLGKTFMQIEWARSVAERTLIVAPLSVARQTVREATKLDVTVRYVRDGDEVDSDGLWITNYEMVERFDPGMFDAVVLDESSILKNVDGTTRRRLTEQFAHTRYRLACTATPAPNDVSELCNHAEFLGAMPRNEMLAAYFVHDDEGWRPKNHAIEPMYKWMSSWSIAMRRPSDLGWPDDGYDLPALNIIPQIVHVEMTPDDQLFATELGGIGGRSKVRRDTLAARVERAASLASSTDDQWIIWCGLNDEAAGVTKLIGDSAVNVEGSWSADDKAEAIEAFQDGFIRVLVTKPSIAGFGMNFQNCHRMVLVYPSARHQTVDRWIRNELPELPPHGVPRLVRLVGVVLPGDQAVLAVRTDVRGRRSHRRLRARAADRSQHPTQRVAGRANGVGARQVLTGQENQ